MPLLFLLGPFRSQRLCLLPSSCCFTVILLGVEVLNTNAHPQVAYGAVFLVASAIYTHYNKDMMIWKLTTMLTDWYYSTYFIQLPSCIIFNGHFSLPQHQNIRYSAKFYAIQPFKTAFLYHTPVPSEIQRFVKSAAYYVSELNVSVAPWEKLETKRQKVPATYSMKLNNFWLLSDNIWLFEVAK